VFIVDLKNKMFVFLDSYFDSNANFQIDASSKLESLFYVILISFSGLSLYLVCTLPIFFCQIIAFKECWYQHAEGYTSLEDFSVSYPAVPKQNNM